MSDGSVGYVGCSVTLDAVLGYFSLGGERLWPLTGEFAGGAVSVWAERVETSQLWSVFQQKLQDNPGTTAIWWELCTAARSNADGLDQALVVLSELEQRVSGATVFVSAQPAYSDGHVCTTAGADGPANMAALALDLVATGRVAVGPVMGPLAENQTRDGCHANDAGRLVMGEQLLEFFDG